MQHATQAKRSLKAVLGDQLPAMLRRADEEADDGIETPIDIRIFTTEVMQIESVPMIELVVTQSSNQADSTSQVYQHRVIAQVTIGGDDQEKIATLLERFIWAIRQVARDSLLSPDPDCGPIDTGTESYGQTVPMHETVEFPFVRAALIELFVTTVGP